jgi:hypothetical protein
MPEIIQLEILVLGALVIVSLVAVLGKRFGVHPAVGLVIAVLLTGQAAIDIPFHQAHPQSVSSPCSSRRPSISTSMNLPQPGDGSCWPCPASPEHAARGGLSDGDR